MIAIKIGTTSWRQTQTLAADEVEFTGTWITASDGFTDWMVWDAGLNNCRAMTQAEIDAIPGQRAEALKAELVALVTAAQREAKLMRAVVLLVLDEFNLHSNRTNALLDAIDAAASLAALKTTVATINNIPPRTKQQLLDAMVAKINAGDTD